MHGWKEIERSFCNPKTPTEGTKNSRFRVTRFSRVVTAPWPSFNVIVATEGHDQSEQSWLARPLRSWHGRGKFMPFSPIVRSPDYIELLLITIIIDRPPCTWLMPGDHEDISSPLSPLCLEASSYASTSFATSFCTIYKLPPLVARTLLQFVA